MYSDEQAEENIMEEVLKFRGREVTLNKKKLNMSKLKMIIKVNGPDCQRPYHIKFL